MKDIQNGTSKGYGNNLKTSNYVRNVINQYVPTYTRTCWVQSSAHVYSDTYKIAEVTSGNKSILEAELSRRRISVQYICGYLGSPEAKYQKEKEDHKIFFAE